MKKEKTFFKVKPTLAVSLALLLIFSAAGVLFSLKSAASGASQGTDGSPADLWIPVKDAQITGDTDAPEYVTVPYGKETLNGLTVLNSADGATVRYKNYIDISNNRGDEPLISFLPIPQQRGKNDFSNLTIRFTDSTDPENYVEIKAMHDATDNGRRLSMSFFQLSFPGVSSRGLRWGGMNDPVDSDTWSGTQVVKTFSGVAFEPDYGTHKTHNSSDPDAKISIMAVSFNSLEKRFYASSNSGNATILDLDDPRHVGYGNEWGGFKSGLVSVTVSAAGFNVPRCNYMIFNINGNDMSGLTVTDVKAPSLRVDTGRFDEIPKAQARRDYRLFDSTADDEIDGNLNASVVKTVYEPDGTPHIVSGAAFVPQVAGIHVLEYSVYDAAGNRRTHEISFTVMMAVPPVVLNISATVAASALVGDRIVIPSFKAEGGSGGFTEEVSVTGTPSGKAYTVTDGFFVFELPGLYRVEFRAVDYIGNEMTEMHYIEVRRGTKPLCYFPNDGDFPKAFIEGKPTELPEIEAYDYITDPAKPRRARAAVDVSYDGGATYTAIDDYLFTPAEGKTSAKIRYRVYVGGALSEANGGNYVSKVYTAEIRKPQYAWDYFIQDNISTDGYHSREELNRIEFTAENTAKNASVEFINSVSVRNFSLLFFVPEERNNYSSLNVVMTDSLDASQRLELEIRKTSQKIKSDVYFNGSPYEMSGSFFKHDNAVPFELKFNSSTFVFTDNADKVILRAAELADGTPFKGFTSGRVFFKMEMKGVSGASSVYVQRGCNQGFFPTYNATGELQNFRDNGRPLIELGFEPELDADINEKIFLPAARALDVIDPYIKAYVSVYAPDGTPVILSAPAETAYSFIASQYGEYYVTYSATDLSMRPESLDFRILISNKDKPDIFLEWTLPSVIGRNKTHNIPTAKLFGSTDDIRLHVYIITPALVMTEITGAKKYTFKEAGEYTLMYYAVTQDYYYSIKTITVTVK